MSQSKGKKAAPIYGLNSVASAIENDPVNVLCLYVSQQRQDKRINALLSQAKALGLRVETVEPRELDKRAGDKHHQGVVADYRRPPMADEKDLADLLEKNPAPFLLVLDCVQDPHNFGACLRSAAAAGVDAVIVPKDHSASVSATVRKASAGTVDQVTLVEVGNLSRCLTQLKDKGVWLFGASGEAQKLHIEADLKGAVALVLGAEGEGLRRRTTELCDHLIKIPMNARVESLNVSVACGVLLFEAVRQRMR